GIGSGGLWTTDVDGEAQVSTSTLRTNAGGPLTFLCATIGSGSRLGIDRDLDGHLNRSDCSDGDPALSAGPTEVSCGAAAGAGPSLTWDDQTALVGATLFYEVAGGSLQALHTTGTGGSASCLAGDLSAPSWNDGRGDPPPGDGFYYLIRARNSECS